MTNALLLRRRGMVPAAAIPQDDILTFTAISSATVKLQSTGTPPAISVQTSNNGITWSTYTIGDTINLSAGQFVKFRGTNTTISTSNQNYHKFYITGTVAASGDITSLLNGVGGDTPILNSYGFYGLFYSCAGLVSAPRLPSTSLNIYCYYALFYNCTGLTIPPELPATIMETACYQSIFSGCTRLTVGPFLPATTLANHCYYTAFRNCSNIKSHHVATLNASINAFQGNSSCESFIIDDPTPPTIGNNTITGLKADCIIYVPAGSVEAYKAKQYWSDRAAYIQAIQ